MSKAMTKTTFTKEEVVRLLGIVGKASILNPILQKGDEELLKRVGYKVGNVENSHGGYSYVEYVGNNDEN